MRPCRRNEFYIPFIQTHILRDERFEMEDLLASHLAPMLVVRRPFDDLWLECVFRHRYQLPRQRLDDGRRVDAV